MARTHGPLFSLEASGSVASTITFSKWKGRPYVRSTIVPSNPRSAGQVSTRAMMTFLSQVWKGMLAGAKTTWDPLAKSGSFSPFNAFVKTNQKRWTQYTGPTESFPPVTAAAEAAPTLGSATAGVKQLTIAWTDSVGVNDWGTIIHASVTAGFTPSKTTAVAMINHGKMSFVYTGLLSGTPYYFRLQGFDDAGNLGLILAQFTGTPT